MKTLPIITSFLLVLACSPSQRPDAEQLARELDSIMVADQQYRTVMDSVMQAYGVNSPQMMDLWKVQLKIDSSNLARVREIIKLYGGLPARSQVGVGPSETVFFVLQHAPDSVHSLYIDMILEAAKDNELDKSLAAMYHDRYLMHNGQDQLYGTQVRFDRTTDPLTNEERDSAYVWPIADTTNIDDLRYENNLGPLEEYLSHFGLSRWKN